ncbi:MAG: helix-turn-helix transcriptional regulator [Chloroflexi bacterium]|nr:helix-turn-helix transcriptional regulator [Chloroflexota bacterium]
MKEGSKYFPLYRFLRQHEADELRLTIDEIEALLQAALPKSARAQRAWWSNRAKGALQAQAWMAAKYHVEDVDLEQEWVIFRKRKVHYEATQVGDTVQWNGELINGLRQHMKLSQGAFADELGVRQQTISEWERGSYLPSRATSKYLTMVAERAGFAYQVRSGDE